MDRLDEWVKVRHDEVERLDAELLQLMPVGADAQVGEDARVHGVGAMS